MKTIKGLIDVQKGREALIVGAGATTKGYKSQINRFIHRNDPFIIGINNIFSMQAPHYHLWTNTQRFRTYGKGILEASEILLGSNIPIKVIKGIIKGRKYTLINYTDKEGIPIQYKDGVINGWYRTAGNLAIMICHLMGAKKISIVGMDGYTRFGEQELKSRKESQHCYGSGHTDTADYKSCIAKDKQINAILHNIQATGIEFNILTPTKYTGFYNDRLGLHS